MMSSDEHEEKVVTRGTLMNIHGSYEHDEKYDDWWKLMKLMKKHGNAEK